jgi:hypothetical protein
VIEAAARAPMNVVERKIAAPQSEDVVVRLLYVSVEGQQPPRPAL